MVVSLDTIHSPCGTFQQHAPLEHQFRHDLKRSSLALLKALGRTGGGDLVAQWSKDIKSIGVPY